MASRDRRTAPLLTAALLLGCLTAPGLAQDHPAPSRPALKAASPARPAAPDPAFEAARAAFEALPEAELGRASCRERVFTAV